MPVWLAVYRFQKETYRVFVNARTGDIHGERPYSVIKITIAVILGLIAVGGIVAFILANQ